MAAPIDPYADFVNGTIPDVDKFDARMKVLFDALDKTKVGLDANSFKTGAFTAVKFATAQAWQTTALSGLTWTAPALLSYYKDQIGMVRLRNEALPYTGTFPAGTTTIGTMPAGYRPGVKIYGNIAELPGAGGANTPVYLSIDTDGTMQILNTSLTGSGGSLYPYAVYRAEN